MKPSGTDDSISFEVEFEVESKGKYSVKANTMIVAKSKLRVGEKMPESWQGKTDEVHFVLELPKNKIEPLD